jgi:alpha-beta hydrolase superfamily lysophospholipase
MEKLKESFDFETIPLKDDYEGKAIATLISAKANTGTRQAVLYIHGFIDYFFHPHVADFFDKQGFDFYALDLRKYGHSLLHHQHASFCKSLDEYFEEMDYSIKKIYDTTQKSVILFGHSTGGLTVTVYANKGKYKQYVGGLILNSPFLEMNVSAFEFYGLKLMHVGLTKILPAYTVAQKEIFEGYGKSIHKDYNGEWDYNLNWKPIKGFPAYFKWLKTIMENQQYLKENSNLKIPVLLLHASKSFIPKKNSKGVEVADVVLNVEHMKQIGPKLGNTVTLSEVKDGIHDIFLSKKEARDYAFEQMLNWLKKYFK